MRQQGPGTFLCCSGERAEESPRRASKPIFEIYKAAHAETKQRFVHWLRPIHHLHADQVWELMRLAEIDPHPCYQWVSRCSCRFCIFLSPSEMKKVSELYPDAFQRLIEMEKLMGVHTMKYEKGQSVSLESFITRAEAQAGQTS